MGLRTSKYESVPEPATLTEALIHPLAKKIRGNGRTLIEALDNLSRQCKKKGYPEPKLIPGTTDMFYCGIINHPNPLKPKQKLYNTVFLGIRDNVYIAVMWWHPGLKSKSDV